MYERMNSTGHYLIDQIGRWDHRDGAHSTSMNLSVSEQL